jgi:hypothetical protein
VCGFVRRPGGRVTFSVSPEKVTKERRPTRPRAPMKPATARGRYGGSLTGHPWPDSERARIVRAPLWAVSFAPSPRPRGTRKQKQRQKQDSSVHPNPLCRGEGRTDKPRARHAGGARDRADSIVRPGWPVDRTRSPAAHRPLCGRRGTEGVFSLVTFSCTSKRKSRAGQDGRQDAQGCESVFAPTFQD